MASEYIWLAHSIDYFYKIIEIWLLCRNRASKFWITQIQMIDMLLGRSDRLWKKSPPHKDNYKRNSALKTASTGEKNKLDVVSGESHSTSEILQRQSFSGYLGEGPETLQRRPRGQATVIYWLLVKKLTPDRASKRAVSWGKGGLITATYPHLSLSRPDAWWVMQTDAHMLKVTHMQVCM